MRRAWDARAWAEGRPDKVTPRPGEDLTARWVTELVAVGYRDRNCPVDLVPVPVGGMRITVEKTNEKSRSCHSGWTNDQTKPRKEPA